MDLAKRDVPVSFVLDLRDDGTTDVHFDAGKEKLAFHLSSEDEDQFVLLMQALSLLHPESRDDEYFAGSVSLQCKYGVFGDKNDKRRITAIRDDHPRSGCFRSIPWKASFTWENKGREFHWIMEREPTLDSDFYIKISIFQKNAAVMENHAVRHADVCYAAAAAYTAALKQHGLMGYAHSTGMWNPDVRLMLELKAIGLGCEEAVHITYPNERGPGETSDFQKEMELLMFDMQP